MTYINYSALFLVIFMMTAVFHFRLPGPTIFGVRLAFQLRFFVLHIVAGPVLVLLLLIVWLVISRNYARAGKLRPIGEMKWN